MPPSISPKSIIYIYYAGVNAGVNHGSRTISNDAYFLQPTLRPLSQALQPNKYRNIAIFLQ